MILSYEQLLFNVLALGDWYVGNALAKGLCGTFTPSRNEEYIASIPERKVLPANTKHRWDQQAKTLQLAALKIHASNKSDAEKKSDLLKAIGDTTDKIRESRWGQSLSIPFKKGSRFADMLENLMHRTNNTYTDKIRAKEPRFPFTIPLNESSIIFSLKTTDAPKETSTLSDTLNAYIACHIIFMFKKLFSLDATRFAPRFNNPAQKSRMHSLASTTENFLNQLIKLEDNNTVMNTNPVKAVISGELSELLLKIPTDLEKDTEDTNEVSITNNNRPLILQVVDIALQKIEGIKSNHANGWNTKWELMPSIKN